MNENIPQPSKKINGLKTFAGDMADAVKEKELSLIKIALAEKEKRDKEKENIEKENKNYNWNKILPVIGGVILISASIFGIYFLSKIKKESSVEPIKSEVETFITYDSKSKIDVTGKEEILDLIIKEKIINQGFVKALFLTEIINEEKEERNITTEKFLSLIKSTIPNALIRSLSDQYLLGEYSNPISSENKKTNTFLIFQTNDYNQAYASMLEWEPSMYKDLSLLFDLPELNEFNSGKDWRDTLINNKDVRVLYGDNKEKILYYVFVNKNNFIITTSIDSLKEIITRLNIKNTKPL